MLTRRLRTEPATNEFKQLTNEDPPATKPSLIDSCASPPKRCRPIAKDSNRGRVDGNRSAVARPTVVVVSRIVITGGPRTGKTTLAEAIATLLAQILAELSALGVTVTTDA